MRTSFHEVLWFGTILAALVLHGGCAEELADDDAGDDDAGDDDAGDDDCPGEEVECADGECHDLQTDDAHCGGCSTPGLDEYACAVGTMCVEATCLPGDNLELMDAAGQLLGATWPNAQLVDVLGVPSVSWAHEATEFGQWRLVFLANDGSGAGNIELWWDVAEGFAEPIYHDDPFYGVMDAPLPDTMSLSDAIALVRQAGYQTAFSSVAMNTPQWPAVPARYSFPAAGGILFVDIGSGAITVEGNVS